MGKGQLSNRINSKKQWDNATDEIKEKRRARAREYYHKNKAKLQAKLSRKRKFISFPTRRSLGI